MKILHLASYYIGSKVYKELVNSINEINSEIEQIVYVPIKNKKNINVNKIEKPKIEILYRNVQNNLDRLLYKRKIKKTYADLKNEIKLKDINYIYAHTIFADGALAYNLKRDYNIDYTVVVRNSDVNAYLKYMPNANKIFVKIIQYAKKVVFISPCMKKQVETKLKDEKLIKELNEKSVIIPNGINEYWHTNRIEKHSSLKNNKINFIQVSTLDKNKNLYATIDLVKYLSLNGYDVNLSIIGKGKYKNKYKKYVQKQQLQDKIKFLGYISEKESIKDYYRKNDIFIMLSKTETFGLVYIEAMSQGLPVIFSKNTGIDGYFDDNKIGFSLEPNNLNFEKAKEGIEFIKENYSEISRFNIEQSKEFNWKIIAKKYLER